MAEKDKMDRGIGSDAANKAPVGETKASRMSTWVYWLYVGSAGASEGKVSSATESVMVAETKSFKAPMTEGVVEADAWRNKAERKQPSSGTGDDRNLGPKCTETVLPDRKLEAPTDNFCPITLASMTAAPMAESPK